MLPLARDVNECVVSIGGAQRAMAERVRAYGFAPFEGGSGGDARVLVKEKQSEN